MAWLPYLPVSKFFLWKLRYLREVWIPPEADPLNILKIFNTFWSEYSPKTKTTMNWKLILSLSLFGLLMAVATITWIPSSVEPYAWLLIFLLCAWLIAKNAPGQFFWHGFLVSIVNCIWITAAHILFSDTYLAHHAQEATQYSKMNTQFGLSPTAAMLIIGPMIGIVSGLVLGLFAFIASKLTKQSARGQA